MAKQTVEYKVGKRKVIVDRGLCIGNQSCVNVAPDVFELDGEQIVTVLGGAPADTAKDLLIEACEACPVSALMLIDEDGTTLVG
jgi:ferredoxin